MKELEGVGKLSSTGKIISYLKNNGFYYMISFHAPVFQGVKSEIFITEDNSDDYEVEHDVVVFHDDEQKELDRFIKLGSKSLNCTD